MQVISRFHFVYENRLHVVLMMDVGSSMDPFARLVSQLFMPPTKQLTSNRLSPSIFTIASTSAFSPMHASLMERLRQTSCSRARKKPDSSWWEMLTWPYELVAKYGAIDYYQHNDTRHRLAQNAGETFEKIVWFNPIPRDTGLTPPSG